ncbi:LOW QUALITY PROTEIN: olfactory receptor 14A16-like [Lontra canadensis]|uniref:LOW QUALITY PROTEIN: olfactory receptor 14A16-like n=1 Tax=Lontra canadensis TaxID=76717 RepID=UPI0013F30F39|nr:LOW QUALITY PROTEIN: olfactory receptor 14A16-like [Lontra canadensis]
MNNVSVVTEFLILGFSDPWSLQLLQSVFFTVIYLLAMVGNGLIISITSLDPCLNTPIYFFLRNLSLFDLCLISAVVPKIIVNSLTHSNSLSFFGCVTQVFLVPFSAGAELFLLTVMSIDRYAAICHPLHYEVIMKRGTCVQMVALSWLSGGLVSVIHTAGTFSLSYCGINEIQQFFCDIPQLLAITCSENITAEIVLILINAVLDFCCFICITVSYFYIFSTVSKIPSTKQSKTYFTCLPHLAAVVLFVSTAFFAYLKPILGCASFTDLVLSSFYILLPPSLNPIIYSLRNKAMKTSLGKLITRKLLIKENILIFFQE